MDEMIFPVLLTYEDRPSEEKNKEGSPPPAPTGGALMNEKARIKSRESGRLWLFHPETKRVLPHEGNPPFTSWVFRNGVHRVSLPASYADRNPYGTFFSEYHRKPESCSGSPGTPKNDPPGSRRKGREEILSRLSSLIRKRKEEQPAGSYTTHLFKSGPGKIRKKLGEEAVELILAERAEEIVSEAADLFYHTLLFLVDQNIPLEDIWGELEKRSGFSEEKS